MSIISYAQNFEDVMLWRALGQIEHGFYIDIGAQDPIIDSISKAFYDHGWRGIHVEPTPHYADLLRQQRPGDTVIQAAVGKGPAKLPFFEIPDTGISTADPVIAQQHRERGFNVHEITVPCIALSAVFKTCARSEIHWLKIDVEGFEKQVLSSWGKSKIRPWIVVVESTLPLTQIETHETWEAILIDYGYTPVYFDGLNRYYISDAHPELKNAFLAPPNVFDSFTLNGTASAPFHHLIDARYKETISELLATNDQQKQYTTNEIERLTLSLASLGKTHAVQQSVLQRQHSEREQALQGDLATLRETLVRTQTDAAVREKELSDLAQQTLEKARSEAQAHLRELVERERAFVEQLAQAQREAHQAASEQSRVHSEREQALQGDLATLRETLVRTQTDAAVREKELSDLAQQTLEKARNEAQAHLRELVERERAFVEHLAQAQRETQQTASEQSRVHSEREQAVVTQLLAAQQEFRRLQQDRAHREKEHAEQTRLTLQELEVLLRTQAQREQEVAEQLLTIQQQAAQEKAEQVRSHSEQEHALQRQHTEREQTLSQVLLAAQQELYRLEQDRAQREEALDKEIAALQSEIQALHHAQQLRNLCTNR